jgi:hypothetical protein
MLRIGYDPQYIQGNGDFGSVMTLIAVVRFEQFVLFLLPCTCSRGCRFWLLEFWNIYHGLSKCTVIIGSHFGYRLRLLLGIGESPWRDLSRVRIKALAYLNRLIRLFSSIIVAACSSEKFD